MLNYIIHDSKIILKSQFRREKVKIRHIYMWTLFHNATKICNSLEVFDFDKYNSLR